MGGGRGGRLAVPGSCTAGLLVGLVVASLVAYDCLWLPETTSLFRLQWRAPTDELQVELEGTSMGNMTLIIGSINKASVEGSNNGSLLHLFLRSLREGEGTEFLIQHVLFLAGDQTSYDRCRLLRLHCHRSSTQSRLLLGEVLKRGYSFIFTDMDVMWLRNPFTRLKYNGADMHVSRDLKFGHPWDDDSNSTNSGLFFVSSNEKTIALFTEPQKSATGNNSEGRKEEEEDDVLRLMRSRGALRRRGLNVKYLATKHFTSFCQQDQKLDITNLVTVHANCCPDARAKVADLTAFLDTWRAAGEKLAAPSSCARSWKSYQLESALRGASMENKTLIVSYLNKAYVEENGMLDLFIRSLREGEGTEFLVNHLFLITVDQAAFSRCKKLKLHCYQLVPGDGLNFDKEQSFMSEGYINLVWQKIIVLREILKRGYNFIFTDMDIIWLRNPFARLNLGGAEDLQISCDSFNGKSFDEANSINTGFFYVVSNERTVELLDVWLESRKAHPKMNDQEALVVLKSEGVFRRLGLKVRFLDTRLFSGFCQVSKSAGDVTTMHANCCVTLKAKVEYLSGSLEAWKKAVAAGGQAGIAWPRPICARSWGKRGWQD